MGEHPVFTPLAEAAAELAADSPAPVAEEFDGGPWDSFRFVDLSAAALDADDADELLLRQIARGEWELLLDFCYGRAIGAN